MFLKKLLPAISVLVFSVGVEAEMLSHPYQVREPVVQDSDREAMLLRALDTLLVRLTADTAAPQNPALAALRQTPQQLVSQFGVESDGSALLVEFDPASVDRALRQTGVPLWGSNRPLLLVWWLQEELSGNQLLSDGSFAASELRRAAQHRGLPLRLPLGDLSEQLITAEELQADNGQALEALAERYAADVQLVVVAAQRNGQWQADWTLRLLDKQEQGQVQAADTAALADAVMLAALQRLGPPFMAAPGQVSDLELWIEGANVARFAELDQLLSSLDARLLRVEGQRLVYRVRASVEQIRAQMGLLRLQEVVVPVAPAAIASASEAAEVVETPAPAPAAEQTPPLRFRW